MRKTTPILFVVLVINTAVMVAGMLLGPDTAASAFFVISIALGAYAAHDVVELPAGGPHTPPRKR